MTNRSPEASPGRRRVTGVAGPSVATGRGTDGGRSPAPLTERILARLPGGRLRWMLVWASVPWLNLVVALAGDRGGWLEAADPLVEVVNRAAVSFAILLSLWGAARIAEELGRLRPALARVVEQDEPDVAHLFRGLDSTWGPLLLTAAIGVVLPLDELARDDPAGGLLQTLTWLLIGIPLSTAVWVYLTLQLGLHRLGRGAVTLVGYRGDRTLGLQSVGSLAFTGFWMLLGAATPLVLTGFTDLPSVLVGTVVILVGVALFFLSQRGLHRQMAAVKVHEVALARRLYEEAYRPVREQPTLEQLQRHVGALNAAEALEKRVERIQAWPFDEGTFARVATIATSAVATILARLLLAPTGL